MKKKYFLLVIIFILVILASIFLPGTILQHHFESEIDVVYEVSPDEYTKSDAYYKNASSQLSEYDKTKLISGALPSTKEEINYKENPDASSITDIEAATLAREAVAELYQANLYPYQFSSYKNNYYLWTAKLYKATDLAFQTYIVYYWVVTFREESSKEVHDVLITENGTLLSIRNNCGIPTPASYNHKLEQHYTRFNFFFCEDTSVLPMYKETAIEHPTFSNRFYVLFGYEKVQTDQELQMYINNYNAHKKGELYYMYVAKSGNYANYTLIPYQ